MTKIIFLLSFSILLIAPNLALSDCVDLGRYTNFYIQGENTILFYNQNTPIAKVVLQDYPLSSSSTIRLLKNYVCDSDSLMVDGQECGIMTVTSASSGPLQ